MDYFILILVSLFASALTLFSGFGLGTLLLPAFALFFPIEVAIALTAIVHFLNNIFKLSLYGKKIDKEILIRFGIPSVLAAFIGSWCLTHLTDLLPLYSYTLFEKSFSITPIKFTMALVMFFFALFELVPALVNANFNKKYLPLGGLLSGFFGGLSGHQGALRSAFLVKAGLSKESFIATGVLIACFIDITRLAVYYKQINLASGNINYLLLSLATLSAFLGAYLGSKLLKKTTLESVKLLVGIFLLIYSVAFGMGLF